SHHERPVAMPIAIGMVPWPFIAATPGTGVRRLAWFQHRESAAGGPRRHRLITEERGASVPGGGRDGDPRADLVPPGPGLRLERPPRIAQERVDAAADERVDEAPVEIDTDPAGLGHRRPVRQTPGAQDGDALRPPVHRAADGNTERVAA